MIIGKVGAVTLALGLGGCDLSAHNPQVNWETQEKERVNAHQQLPKLTEEGTLPASPVLLAKAEPTQDKAPPASSAPAPTAATPAAAPAKAGPDLAAAQAKYATLCVSCHGSDGAGKDAPMAAALTPKPRKFTDKEWQKSKTDEQIANVIKNGGPSVGLSPLMAPFGSMLSEAEVQGLVATIRNFAH
ncbi:MAG: cytochrome c [Deltaproteobacteria bacterium]|nr:cytochrome c [Deltaproteobacteria bacterium]